MIGAYSFVGILMLYGAQPDAYREIAETDNPMHITLIGDAFLRAEDADGNLYFLKSCVLEEDEQGRLCTQIGDKILVLQPPIQIPDSTAKLLIGTNGDIAALTRGDRNEVESIGRLSAAVVRSRIGLRHVAPGVVAFDQKVAPKLIDFGEESRVFLFQGWIDVRLLKVK